VIRFWLKFKISQRTTDIAEVSREGKTEGKDKYLKQNRIL
jgi:hypothetical protein